MFKLLRYYSVTSFVAILAAAVLLTWFYRQVSIQGIIRLAERGNLNLAQVAVNPIRPDLLQFLASVADLRPGSPVPAAPPRLAAAIAGLVHEDHFVARIKIYNLHGVVVFSSDASQIGNDQSTNEGVKAARGGRVASELVYRDTFNTFDEVTEEDNLVQTYLPIRAGPREPVRGVFELYGDVDALMHQTERMQLIVIGGAIPILLALYGALLLIVRRANRTIERQQQTIEERNETLALMAARMLKAEESQKKQVALDLQEGVAQTLAAVKLQAESSRKEQQAQGPGEPADSMIPLLQEAIQEVRTIATDLRPSSLDDLGLLATINTARREFEQRHPGIAVVQRSDLREADIPSALKDVVHRIIVSVFEGMAQQGPQGRIDLLLALVDRDLALVVDVTSAAPSAAGEDEAAALRARFIRMEELTTLSGGHFEALPGAAGGLSLRATWKG